MSTNPAADLYLRPLPYLDDKWLRADLLSSLRHASDTAIFWNHLIHDCELVSTSAAPILNTAGNLSFLGDDGKHHCGVQKLNCSCCANKYCGPLTACNCNACRTLDSDAAVKKLTAAVQTAAAQKLSSDAIFESWLWDAHPDRLAKSNCQRTLLNELHDITLQAAGNCLSSLHLRQQLFIYERYFVALERCKKRQESQLTPQSLEQQTNTKMQLHANLFEKPKCSTAERRLHNPVFSYPKYLMHFSNNRWSGNKSKARSILTNKKTRQNDLAKKNRCTCAFKLNSTACAAEKHLTAAQTLAQVGTQAAVNFSFAFLRRAWRTGEDTELCSALLEDAWESLRELPEASLYNSKEVSDLWIEVLERSMKFLRQVALGGPISGHCVAPRRDRNLALCLLLELCVQKGTLAAVLEGVVILLSLWTKEKSTDDNRDIPQTVTAQLVPILKRFEEISKYAISPTIESSQNIHATESFLRYYTMPDSETAYVDVKKAGVLIMSHLDRMCLYHMPLNNAPIRNTLNNNNDTATTTPTSNTIITTTTTTTSLTSNNKPISTNTEIEATEESLNAESTDNTDPLATTTKKMTTATNTLPNATKPQLHEQRIYALGWPSLSNYQYGFTAEPAINLSAPDNANTGGKSINYLKYSAPVLNFYFQVKKVAFSAEMILFLTQEGRIYMWNIAKPHAEPMLVDELSDVELLDMAAHCEGRHYLALDCYGLVYSWGNGENGRLGHSDTLPRDIPIMVQGVSNVRSVHCGCSYSAAITHEGMLYTWGRGTYGRLGHGGSDDKLIPTLIWALKEHEVIDVALGSGDSHTLCVTSDGLVYAWGDGDFGKLGNGGLNGTQLPIIVETLPRIKRVFVGAQFSLALTHEGRLYTWGKLCGGRLGHPKYEPNQTSVNQPKLLEALRRKTIIDVSVGVSHCLVLSNTGEVYGWGRNDNQQICPFSISREPLLRTPILATRSSVIAHGISCGAAQSIIWSRTCIQSVPTSLPFVIQPAENTFRLIDQLLNMTDATNDEEGRPPTQLSECITVTCLNLLRLQFHAILMNDIAASSVGLVQGKRLLNNLKKRILTLAGGSKVLKTIQKAAQTAVQVGWSILLPTAAERAQTLTSLLPTEPGISCSGHRFMTDLLVSSLMAEGGLETALNQIIRPDNYAQTPTLPLLHLIRQLLRNISTLTQMRLVGLILKTGAVVKQRMGGTRYTVSMKGDQAQLERYAFFEPFDNSKEQIKNQTSSATKERPNPSLDLLHRFQRLLLAHLHQAKPEEVGGAEALLIKYMFSVLTHSTRSVRKAHEVAARGLEGVTDILKSDISDTLLYELIVGLILLKRDRPHILPSYNWSKFLLPLLRSLDAFNRMMCDSGIQDADDMGWPGITSRGGQNIPKSPDSDEFMCFTDVENHVLEGKKYVILKGYVCDINEYESDIPMVNELLEAGIGKDLSEHFETPLYCQCLEVIFKNFKVCRLVNTVNVNEEKLPIHHSKNLTHLKTERALGHLLGLISNLLQTGPTQQPEELQCKQFLEKRLLSGGLQMLQPINPFDEEKTEARSCGSTTVNTPTEPQKNMSLLNLKSSLLQHGNNVQQRIDSFVNNLAEARLTDALIVTWMTLTERFNKENNMILHQQFTIEHPVQELERLMSAALIRHQSLGGLVLNMLERELAGVGVSKPPKAVIEMLRLIYQAKWAVVRQRQLMNRSYKEVCAPMLERLRFLLFEVRPAVSLEQEGLRKLRILHKQPRFKSIVRNIMKDLKAVKKQMQIFKKQDILNVSIQQQQQQQQQLERLQKSQEIFMQNNKKFSNEHLMEENDKQQPYMLYAQENEYEDKCEMHLSNNYLQKLCEKWYFCGELNVPLMNEIVEFVLQDTCDVEIVRRAMYCQVQRYQIRSTGLDMFNQLIKFEGLLDAVQYNLFSGYLGLNLKGNLKGPLGYVLDNLRFLTAFQKVNLLLAQSHILEWAVHELQRLVNEEQQWRSTKGSVDIKHDVNLSAYILVKKIPRARFLLSIFGILARDLGPHELSLLVNMGALGTILGLLRQTGGDLLAAKHHCELSVVYEDILLKQKSNRSNLSGPELAKLMKVGTRIVRGADWKWGDQDGNPPGEGRIISEVGDDGWVRVEWYTGATNSYRMGKEGQYDLRLADSSLNIASPDTELDKEDYSYETPPTSESAPTKLLRYACTRLLEIIAVGIGLHSDKMDKNAVRGLSSMFRSVLDPNSTISHTSALDNWAILGFLRAIAADAPNLCEHLISNSWIEFYLQLLEQPIEREADIFRKVHCLRLLETILVHWKDNEERMVMLVRKLFALLGKLSLFCPYDVSLQQCAANNFPKPPRVLLTCSHSSTVAEEIVGLLRKLHTLPHWNSIINSFLAQKLCVAAELFGEDTALEAFQEHEYIYVMGVLGTIGGYDLRPRIGLQIRHEGNSAKICGFTQNGKALLHINNPGITEDQRRISLHVAVNSAEYSQFSLSRLPLNEMLLNSWAVMLYGPGERKECIPRVVDVGLLRAQQLQLAVLNTNGVLCRHQAALRNILKQRAPLSSIVTVNSPDESLSEEEEQEDGEIHKAMKNNKSNELSKIPSESEHEQLLVQSILVRATQPSPLKASYSFKELTMAALNCTQLLAAQVHAETTAAQGRLIQQLPKTATMVHGEPVYNIIAYNEATALQAANLKHLADSNNKCTAQLLTQITDMGFARPQVEAAIKQLQVQQQQQANVEKIVPTPEQVVQCILEQSANVEEQLNKSIDSDNSESLDSSSDTVAGGSCSSLPETIANSCATEKYETRKGFQTDDQYAMYVRGLVQPGMIVRCCRDFEEIKKGDIGTVLKVDTEGLHDLNVQVDWQQHGNTYWVCFVHIELMELPKRGSTSNRIVVGSQVRLRAAPRYKSGFIVRGSVGTVKVINGKDITVDFAQHCGWQGCINDVECVSSPAAFSSSILGQSSQVSSVVQSDLIEDWSRCLRSLSVSSNETTAKYLLDSSPNYWQSASSNHGKHWIRLEMHDNVLVHNLSIVVSAGDQSHMPTLVVTRVGDTINNLKEYSWMAIKSNDTVVPLMHDIRQYYQWIEIVIKQCRNNGIQCKVHGIRIVGRRKQPDLDLMLMNAAFLACEYDNIQENALNNGSGDSMSYMNQPPCTVMVWGLNDKEQLGGLKGSKVKIPTFSQTISRLRPIHISGGSKSLFIVSQDGKVYACGEGTNGRLGLGVTANVSMPRQVPVLHQYVIKKIAVHSGGKHALALTLDGKVFSWGEGEDGKLGHGNRLTMDKPKIIESLRSKKVRDIACGSSHSAAITSAGELYTWGLGEYGRLGHGDNNTQLKPKFVQALLGKRVIQVACGSRDAQTLALTEEGAVFSWGDGDFGKLGRGGSEGSAIPHEVERLTGIGVIQIECGAQFSLALTRAGEVWTWGKGDYYRLGHGNDLHVRKPQPVQGLRGKKVIHVAVGALHCLAVTDTGQVYAWGDNDHGQQGSGNTTVNKKPALVIGLDSVFVNRVACGSSHSVAWGMPQNTLDDEKKGPLPFNASKDPLGGSSLGIYDGEVKAPNLTGSNNNFQQQQISLSETILSLETNGARQTALNYVLNAMSILQARQLIVSALTSHSKINIHDRLKTEIDCCLDEGTSKELNTEVVGPTNNNSDIIAQGGGEALADPVIDPAVHEPSPEAEVMPTVVMNTFQSLTGSLSLSASLSSNAQQKHSKMSSSAMSVIAATINNQEEFIEETSLTGLDDFTSLLGEAEAKSLVELLKLSVAGRTGHASTVHTIADTLIALGSNSPEIGLMLLETCITELEDLCTSRFCLNRTPKSVMQESSHPYVDDSSISGHVKIPGAEALRLEFDCQCSTEKRNDPLVIMDGSGRVVAMRSGREFTQWAPEVRIQGDEMRWKFTSDSSVNGWGWRFWVHAIMPPSTLHERGSDRAVLSQPSIMLVMALLHERLWPHQLNILLRLAAALSACAQLNCLSTAQRIWALKKLHALLLTKHAPKPLHASLNSILSPLIPELQRQYEYEEPQVRGGIHLMHSEYFKTLAALACDMLLDSVLPPADVHKWTWFRRYCIAVRVSQALIKRTELPKSFCMEVRKKMFDMVPQSFATPTSFSTTSFHSYSIASYTSLQSNLSSTPSSMSYASSSSHNSMGSIIEQLKTLTENHQVFKAEHDCQLLQWLNRRPDDWAMTWGGASTIYGWGHNHRGQLGGLEGSRITIPTPCEALSLLRPLQLAGGEQTLFAVTPDGKLFATGYGSGGRLGVGGTDSWAIPTLVSSLQHVFIKKVAVNSGGKHCLALTTEGDVYSWGEGEDGKLGHGNRMSYDRPKLIEDLTGIGIIEIACGSAHSAAITASGLVLTWGKGRYGRLGHGDSEDQLRPKLVEALQGYRAVDIACGSGDAQTLCITDDDNVWSWGDGDYGKLGRGGSDGCKIPFKIESLAGLGVVKVECGSQFSVALTKSGAVYTWGKGDFHRLGHGSADHIRRPKRVAALQGKKVISIATGSLHCVACTDTGEVYTWGDNDEGQLGDGTVTAIQRPRIVASLQCKHVVKVTCGSAHTLALSTTQLSDRSRPLPNPPLEYDLVRDLPPNALHARLVLLHHFSELMCPSLTMLPITGELSLSALKDVLVYSIKEAAFRKVIQTTMVRDKQHGPVIELNRIQVKRSRNKSNNGLAGVDGMKSVFGQMVQKLPLLTQEALSLPHRVWKVKFVGESVDDCGGGYSESIAEMCDELQNGSVPLLIPTPNGRGEAGANRDCFLLDPTLTSVLQMNMFRFLGVLMGIAVRTGSPLSLNLAEPVWRQLAGEELRPCDLTEVDRDYVTGLLCIRNMDDDPKAFSTLELPFSTSSAKGHEVPLSTRYTRITMQNRLEYVRLALNFRLHEFDEQVKAVRDGMSKVVPVPLLSLFSASELQAMVCGSPDIPLGLLKSVVTYKGFEPTSSLVSWFWEVMEEFTNQERSLFLRFVWGRTRLPRTIADFRGRDFVLQVLEKNPPDHFLPESYTCFFLLKMPRYSCKAVLLEKLKYAIHFCKSIDTDEYARVAMGDPTEATGSEDNSDIESTQDV